MCLDSYQFSRSVMSYSAIPWTAARQASLPITNSQSLLELMSIESVMSSNNLVPFSSCLQSFPASESFPVSQFFASGGQSIEVSASPSVLPMNIQDWFLLGLIGLISLAIQGTLKSLIQHHSSKASILRCSAFFIVQLSHPYMSLDKPSILQHSAFFIVQLTHPYTTTGKTIVLTRWSFVGNVSAF